MVSSLCAFAISDDGPDAWYSPFASKFLDLPLVSGAIIRHSSVDIEFVTAQSNWLISHCNVLCTSHRLLALSSASAMQYSA